MVKYGVVSMEALLKDLVDWQTLYCAGRMQKPVLIIRPDARVQLAQRTNMSNALRTSMLLLPVQFSEEELFLTLCRLSYTGDFRMSYFGEDPHKIYNIVYRQMDMFRENYAPLITDLPFIDYTGGSGSSELQVSLLFSHV
jgi:translocator assembly and maintenance protein 41